MWLSRFLVVMMVLTLFIPVEAQQIPKLTEDMLRQLREREAQIKIKSFCKTETEYCFPEGNGIWHFERVEDHFPDRFNTKYWKPKLIVDDQAALFKLLRQTYDKMRRALHAGDVDEAATYFSDPEKMRNLFYQGTYSAPPQHWIDLLTEELNSEVGPWLGEPVMEVEFRTKQGSLRFFKLRGDNVWCIQ